MISQTLEATTAKRMKILTSSACHGEHCSPLDVLFSNVYIILVLMGVPPLGSTVRIQKRKWQFSVSICDNISQTISNMATLLYFFLLIV